MSKWIDEQLEICKTVRTIDGLADKDDYQRLLEALKLAEEALKTCEARKNRTGYTFWVDIVKVEDALASIAALGKDE